MLTHAVTAASAWRSDTLDPPAAWYFTLPEPCLKLLEQSSAQVQHGGRPLTDARVADLPCRRCVDDLQPVRAALEDGRGFVVVRGLAPGRHSPAQMTAFYWFVGQLLGEPFAQNVQGTLLYDVRDTGQDVRYGARFSVTNAESSFHTDNSFGDDTLDYVGLLCINGARSGGLSQMVSAYAAHNELLARHPDVLDLLYQPFHVDRRGGLRPGEEPTGRFPIFLWDESELTVRYLRYWIEAGHEKVGQPLRPEQVQALDTLDRVLADRRLHAEFTLEPGDMYFLNNRWLLHNRTAFEDWSEPERRRHLVRLWLRAGATS